MCYNIPYGWRLQDRIAEPLADWWRVVRVNLLPGPVGAIIDWFRRLAELGRAAALRGGRVAAVPRRATRSGSLAAKAVLGLVWFPVAYVARFAFYLLIEPQVNPVKHFPVVTVSHKVMLPDDRRVSRSAGRVGRS